MNFAFIFLSFLRRILGIIDGYLYTAAAEVYGLMIDIANATVFEQTIIEQLSERIYQLLGLIMLFKLIFSFLTYVINPEAITDKNKGMGNIIKKIIISLVLIIITPWAFMQSRNLQVYVIQDGLIDYFVSGQSTFDVIDPGYRLMFTTAKLFITPYECGSDCSKCVDDGKGNCRICSGEKSNWENYLGNGEFGATTCAYGTKNLKDSEAYGKQLKKVITTTPSNRGQKYDLRALMGLTSFGDDQERNGLMFYTELRYPFIGTTLVGGVILYMLIIMCIDIAVRSVKLSFYEIIAPIPIMSYIGFKDGKDSMISKWFNQVLKTYADLFTRVLALQFAVYFIGLLIDGGIAKYGFFVSLFLIIGALTFAKQLPSILKDIGINFEGGGFNLKKKLNENMAGSKLLKRGAAAGLGLAGGAGANLLKAGSNFFKDRQANKKLKEEMAAQGYDGFGKKERNDFYNKNRSDSNMMKLGSSRARRAYARSEAVAQHRANNISEGDRTLLNAKKDSVDRIKSEASQASEAVAAYRRQRKNANPNLTDLELNTDSTYKSLVEKAASKNEHQRQVEEDYRNFQNQVESQSKRGSFAAGARASAEYTKDHASEFGSNVIAGAISSAAHAATSKDGKIFAGAREGIRESVEARDLRDKRQEADYGTVTRIADSIRTMAGIDPESKVRANEMHDEITQLQTVLGNMQEDLRQFAGSSGIKYDRMQALSQGGAAADSNEQEYVDRLKVIAKQQVAVTKKTNNLKKLYEVSKGKQ